MNPLQTSPNVSRRLIAALGVLIAIVAAVAFFNARSGWEVAVMEGEGSPSVDGRPVPAADARQLARRLRPGARLRLPPTLRLVIRSRGALRVEIAPGADVTIPRLPGRWWGRRAACELESGAIHVAAETGFAGALLTVTTPGARVELRRGTALVAAEPRGTRVGVLAGEVRTVMPGAAVSLGVPPGSEVFLFHAALDPARAPLGAADREALARLDRAARR